ncbi:response regulator [Embleya sp. NPDC056575]|uniref:response regulator n=1 Tax=unclassified Embleya TaxID=2699296 RepID=UPI0036AAD717
MNERGVAIEVLLVEDDPGDVLLTREAFADGVPSSLRVVGDGVAALDFLHRRAGYEDAPRPDLILLDLQLPRMGGREVLEHLKADADLRRIPVVVLASSSAEEDILRSYDLHANAYVTKPVNLDHFVAIVRGVDDFFRSIVRLPDQM